jgi:hypothetical protein
MLAARYDFNGAHARGHASCCALSFHLIDPMMVLLARHDQELPADAANWTALRSNAFFVLGLVEPSQTSRRVTEEIQKNQAGREVSAADPTVAGQPNR